jgi:hypothetical protein
VEFRLALVTLNDRDVSSPGTSYCKVLLTLFSAMIQRLSPHIS